MNEKLESKLNHMITEFMNNILPYHYLALPRLEDCYLSLDRIYKDDLKDIIFFCEYMSLFKDIHKEDFQQIRSELGMTETRKISETLSLIYLFDYLCVKTYFFETYYPDLIIPENDDDWNEFAPIPTFYSQISFTKFMDIVFDNDALMKMKSYIPEEKLDLMEIVNRTIANNSLKPFLNTI